MSIHYKPIPYKFIRSLIPHKHAKRWDITCELLFLQPNDARVPNLFRAKLEEEILEYQNATSPENQIEEIADL
jgi:hypothetical protein